VSSPASGLRNRRTRIEVRLPLDFPRPSTSGAETGGSPVAAVRSLRVLIVDDNRDAAESLAMAMRRWKHQVRVVHNGNDAIALASTFRPEVLLLDIGLPGKNGFEVAQEVRASESGAKSTIVAITGYGSSDDRTRSRSAGIDQHLVKPVSLSTLAEILASRAMTPT
jgi:DNA-binding response OmpR family regulator